MTANPHTIAPDASLYELASYFIDERVGAVPVVDDADKLIGIVSYIDVLAFLLPR
jgi:CBS domain-containing protein